MARAGTRILDTGDTFPDLNLTTVDGAEISTRSGLKEAWVALIIYRGSAVPVLHFAAKARETQKLTGATFPIALRVSVRETAEATVAFFEPAPTHTSRSWQSAGFVLGPDRRVMVSAYSSACWEGSPGRTCWPSSRT